MKSGFMTSTWKTSIPSWPHRNSSGKHSCTRFWNSIARRSPQAQGIVIVHPNWWGQPPAILKGWVDRVLRPEVAYRFLEGDAGEGVPVGLLKAKAAIVFNTSNTPRRAELASLRRPAGNPLEKLHLWVVRRPALHPQEFRRGGDQHP